MHSLYCIPVSASKQIGTTVRSRCPSSFLGLKPSKVNGAVVISFNNAEISVSERLDYSTTWDDYDRVEGDFYNAQIISTNDIGVATQAQLHFVLATFLATFSRGMVVIDSVDEDERCLYVPRERIRKDVSSTVDHPKTEGDELVVKISWSSIIQSFA